MATISLVLQIVALASVSTVCVYLVIVLIRVQHILDSLERDMKEISSKAIPILENVEVITDKIKSVTETINEQVDSVKYSIDSLKEITDNIVSFERRIQEGIEVPVMETIDSIASILRGIRSFIDRLPFISRLKTE